MKFLFKNFFYLFRAFKSSAIINILGLSAALVVLFIVLMQVHYDLTYDKSYNRSEDIVQFNTYRTDQPGLIPYVNFQIASQIRDKIPEVEVHCLITNLSTVYNTTFYINEENNPIETQAIPYYLTTSGFQEIFSPQILDGDIGNTFTEPGKALIAEKVAKQLFGEENPIGKPIRSLYTAEPMTISAVYKDFPNNSSLKNGIYTFLPENPDPSQWGHHAYFLVKEENLHTVNNKINTKEILGDNWIQYLEGNSSVNLHFKLSPLKEFYLYNAEAGGNKRITTTRSLLVIGILTILIAFINFVNLSLAMAPARIKAINLRKILGINKTFLKLTIAMESVFFILIALGVSFITIHLLKNSTLAEQMFATDLSLWTHAKLLASASSIVLIISFCIGIYASQYCTSFDESQALKGSFALGVQGIKLRNTLIVLQFTTAIGLIAISTFIRIQHNYMVNYDWGIPKENIIYFSLGDIGKNYQAFGEELLRNPRITDYCMSRDLPGEIEMGWGRHFEGKVVNLFLWSVDDRFFNFFDVEITTGRNPVQKDSLVSQIVVNETFVKKYEFDENIIGKDFYAFGPGKLQAIAKDINFQSLHKPIVPMGFGVLHQASGLSYFLVKIDGQEIRDALNYIREVWTKFSNKDFKPQFLDKEMEQLYQKESNMAQLIGIFGFIIALIAIMGVYGLIIFNTRYKKKEIGIRKVNGASIKEIILMLNQNLLILLTVSFAIVIPVGFYAINLWLSGFAYKASIPWWLFPASGIIVLIISSIAVSGQSLKAARSNPAEIIKSE